MHGRIPTHRTQRDFRMGNLAVPSFGVDRFSTSNGYLPDTVLGEGLGWWYIPLCWAMAWTVTSLAATALLSGRFWLLSWTFTLLLIFIVTLPPIVKEPASPRMQELFIAACQVGFGLAILLGTLIVFHHLHRTGEVPRQRWIVMLGIAVFLTAVAFAWSPLTRSFPSMVVTMAFVALIVFPLAAMPLAIRWNRIS